MRDGLNAVFIFGTYAFLRNGAAIGAVYCAAHAAAMRFDQAPPADTLAICIIGLLCSVISLSLGRVRGELTA